MNVLVAIYKRELRAYFSTPVAYIFVVGYLFLNGICTFYIGQFYENEQADLTHFFQFHPWLYLLLIPAISMRLWSEERKEGTIELLMTLPVTLVEAVLGKFFAAWTLIAIALVLTFPVWITVNYLGEPDNIVILVAYIGSLLMAGGYLAIGSCVSALTKNQIISFVVSVVVCSLFTGSGYPLVLDFVSNWAPQFLLDAISLISFDNHYIVIMKGIIDIRSIIFFLSIITLFLYLNILVLEQNKAD